LVFLVAATVPCAAQPTPPTATPISQLMPEDARELQIGDPAPDFSLPGVDGKTHTLSEYRDADLLMIAFLSNHCPDSHAAQIRIQQLVQDLKGKSFVLVAINPTNPDGLSIDEL